MSDCKGNDCNSKTRSEANDASEGTHVTDIRVARLRIWDQLRWMLAVNSTLLGDDPGLKHFNAQE